MFGTNLVVLCGTLGRPAEYREFDNGSAVANFTIATTDPQDRTSVWHRIVAKNNLAQVCASKLQKGSIVTVVGHLKYRTYIDQNTGIEKDVTEIIAHKLDIMPSSSDTNVNSFDYQEEQVRNGFGNQNQSYRPKSTAPQFNKTFNNNNHYQNNQGFNGYQNNQSSNSYQNRPRNHGYTNQGSHNGFSNNNQGYQKPNNQYPKSNTWNNPHSNDEKKFHQQQMSQE